MRNGYGYSRGVYTYQQECAFLRSFTSARRESKMCGERHDRAEFSKQVCELLPELHKIRCIDGRKIQTVVLLR